MTKREAVKGLERLKTIIWKESNMQIALDMAIEALEQEQQRQEDIYECQYCFGEVHKNYIYCPFCGKRIEALEQEETLQNFTKPNKSDLISRQDAIDAVGKAMPQLTTPDGCGEFDHDIQITDEAFVDCMQIINGLPSAQPFTTEQIQTMQELEAAQIEKAYELGKADRPTGHWLDAREEDPCWYICSECKRMVDDDSNYCPNCGARMESDADGSD